MELFFSAAVIKRLIYLFLVVGSAFYLQLHYAASWWLPCSALVFSLLMLEQTPLRREILLAVIGAISIFDVFLINHLIESYAALIFGVIVIIGICTYIGRRYDKWLYPAFILSFFTILAGFFTDSQGGDSHLYDMLIGIVIVMIAQFVFSINFARNEMQFFGMIALKKLKQLTRDIFACLIQPEYGDNIYLFERRLHAQKIGFMHALTQMRKLTQSNENSRYVDAIAKLEKTYEILLDCAQLRWRVTDFTTFQLCSSELSAISDAIVKILTAILHKQIHIDTKQLEQQIQRLDENYQQVLKVTAREPLVFLLFISSLQSLREELESVAQ